ncbi:hypothetical protein COLO4_21630 [Corchorus olitorius]|uniref:F-box associated beta-propeller type 1 domain-containing protein n=1 Tax=Corchorus olitorius TaxID=93759 RepID=A0A1R3IS68_9ROSI|nr:hypothetical protein COLO4_21630 [Corchorus olitorius]
MALVNGAPHWAEVASRDGSGCEIVCFDFSKNKLTKIPKPNHVDYKHDGAPRLFDMEGRLCIGYDYTQEFKIEIWVMMEYGVEESWIKLAVPREDIPRVFHRPIWFAKDDVVSLVQEENSVAIYTGTKRRTEIKSRTNDISKILASPYVESLVSIFN